MKYKQSQPELLEERDSYVSDHHNVLTDKEWLKLEQLGEHNKSMTRRGLESSVLFDLHAGRNIHHYSLFNHHLQRPAINTNKEDNINDINGLIHPDDLTFFISTQNMGYCIMTYLIQEQLMRFSTYCIVRLRNKNGTYDIYLLHAYVILLDAVGKPWIIKIEAIKIRGCLTDTFYPQRQFILLHENSNCVEKCFNPLQNYRLSTLQLQVLTLARDGKSVKETALMLHTTESNINYHRAQAKEKLNVPTLSDACILGVKMRMIDDVVIG